MKSIFKWKNSLSLYLMAIVMVNIALLNFPLTNVFGYEFSVINSMLIVILSGIYTISFYDSYFDKNNHQFTSDLFESVLLMTLAPITVSIINSLLTGFCSFIDGLLFYLVITLPSVVIGMALGMLSVFLADRFKVLLLFLIYFGILSIIFFELYFNPQVYFYNPIIGFFPGTIYDEGISVSWNLVLYRTINIIFFGYIIRSITRIKKGKSRKAIPFMVSIILILSFYYLSPRFGFSTTGAHLDDKLYNKIISDHFVINYDTRISESEIKLLALNHEYYYQQLKDFFQIEITEKTHTYLFFDNQQKKELFGSRNADVAKPWLNQIYISFSNWEHTLKHELAHCFSGMFGGGIFKLAAGLNPLLIEGTAEAADGSYDENSIHFMAALAYKSEYKEDVQYLLTKGGFFSRTSSLSYVYAGSFIKYLINKEGIQKFKQYYISNEFIEIYGIDLNTFLNDYYSFLNSYEVEYSLETANYYFGRKSLFQKVCPRAISVELQNGWEYFRKYDYVGAQKIFGDILLKANNYSALIGLAKSYEEQDSLSEAIKLLSNKLMDFEGTSYYYNLELKLADLYSKSGNFIKSDSLYLQLAEQKPNRVLNYLSNMRSDLLRKDLITKYLYGSYYDKYYILRSINKSVINYWAYPVLINLSKQLDEDYDYFIEKLNMNIKVNSYESSYAMLKLSEHMLLNYDFINARKYAALAMRFNLDNNFYYIINEQFKKADWFHKSSNSLLQTLQLSNNN